MIIEQTLRLLLDGVGRSEEYEFYLGRFRSYEAPCFSFLVPDLFAAKEARSSVLASLEFLRKLELFPGILLAGSLSRSVDAELFRAQTDLLMPIAVESVNDDTQHFLREEALRARNESRVPAFFIDLPLEKAVRLCSRITNRFHFLRMEGPIQTTMGPAPYVDPSQPLEFADDAESAFAAFARDLSGFDPGLHISLCSPFRLLQEIFTVKGAGTIFRPRSRILHFSAREAVDQEKLVLLLESSFGRRLKDTAFLSRVTEYYIEENYRGAILLEPSQHGLYLSKFAVSTLARGEGIAQDLWSAALQAHPTVFWRTKRGNSIERWYSRIADGSQKKGKWNIYWKNLDLDRIADVIRYCENRAEDFQPV